jgi:hypothetical protein
VTDFKHLKVKVEEVDDNNWRLLEGFDYRGNVETFHVPAGQATDFASVPRVFAWFMPRYGRYTKAAILHDYLWRELAAHGELRYVDADGIFRRAMRELDVPFLRRWILWGAVRIGALVKPGGRRGWLRQAVPLLLVSIVALPIVLPPAVLAGLALVVFLAVEAIVWVPLKLVEIVKRQTPGARVKEVNPPGLTWRL